MYLYSVVSLGDRKRKNSTEEKAVPMKNGKRFM